MKRFTTTVGILTAALLASAAEAKTISVTTTLNAYGGKGAYLAIYLTDAQGKVHSTLHIAGPKTKYYTHLRDWSRGGAKRIDGVTGASVGSGKTLKVNVAIADALLDAGYQIRVDSSVEDRQDHGSDVVVPLTAAGSGRTTAGKGYIKAFQFDM